MVQVYTGFGYDGVGACRRIKDQLVVALTEEGTTWGGVVKKAVDELSWKEPVNEGTVIQLVSEAEELKEYLEKLEHKMDSEEATAVDSDSSFAAAAQAAAL